MSLLPEQTITGFVQLLLGNGAVTRPWLDNLFALLPPAFRATLPEPDTAKDRLIGSLARLNAQVEPIDGTLPFAVVLELLSQDPSSEIASRAKQLLNQLAAPGSGSATDPLAGALGDLRLVGAALFAGRDGLRATFRRLATPGGPCVVTVNGPPQVGKSHTRRLLAHAASRSSVFHLAWCEIEPEQEAQFTADWLIEELVHSVVPGAGNAPPRREPPARWYSELASWAVHQFAQLGDKAMVWMVVDGASRPSVIAEVRGVVERLAALVATPTGPVALRLILVDCDPATLQQVGCAIDPVSVVHLTMDEARACLQALLDPPKFTARWTDAEAALKQLSTLTTRGVAAELERALA
ncbi:MAG TPA: hypothetical protein VGD37_35065 [Kofleriaceae bacterium]